MEHLSRRCGRSPADKAYLGGAAVILVTVTIIIVIIIDIIAHFSVLYPKEVFYPKERPLSSKKRIKISLSKAKKEGPGFCRTPLIWIIKALSPYEVTENVVKDVIAVEHASLITLITVILRAFLFFFLFLFFLAGITVGRHGH